MAKKDDAAKNPADGHGNETNGVTGAQDVTDTASRPGPGEGTAPQDTPAEDLFSLAELADKNRVASWQAAALHRLMDWEAGKRVSAKEYKDGLARLKTRRMGG